VRHLLLSLSLANLLFFGWAHWIDTPPAAPVAVAHVPALLLLNAAPAAPAPADAPASPAGGPLRCVSLGPVAEAAAIASLSTALRARNLTPRERRGTAIVTDGYWVYIDNLRDATARGRALQRLTRSGVRDAAALADSGQVSVGLFSAKEGADKRAAAVRAAGFDPVIEVRSHPVNAYWLDVDLPSDYPPPAVGALAAGLNREAEPAWSVCQGAAAPTTAAPPSATNAPDAQDAH